MFIMAVHGTAAGTFVVEGPVYEIDNPSWLVAYKDEVIFTNAGGMYATKGFPGAPGSFLCHSSTVFRPVATTTQAWSRVGSFSIEQPAGYTENNGRLYFGLEINQAKNFIFT